MMNELWLKDLKAQRKEVAKALPHLNSEDIAEDTQVRMVFVTASPVLTNEVDASLKRSFFSRTDSGKIIGMESSLGWPCEDIGVSMIN